MRNVCWIYEDAIGYGQARVEINGYWFANTYRSLFEAACAACELELVDSPMTILLTLRGKGPSQRSEVLVRNDYDPKRLGRAGFHAEAV